MCERQDKPSIPGRACALADEHCSSALHLHHVVGKANDAELVIWVCSYHHSVWHHHLRAAKVFLRKPQLRLAALETRLKGLIVGLSLMLDGLEVWHDDFIHLMEDLDETA